MKKFLSLFLSAAVLLALLGGCTAGGPEDTGTPPASAGPSASVSPTDNTQEPSLALPSAEPSEGPSPDSSAEPSQEPSEAPATQAPATQPPATTHHPEESHHPETTHHPEESHHPETTHHPEESHHPASQPPETQPPESQAPESSSGIPGFPGGVVVPGFGGGGGGSTEASPSPSQSTGGDIYEPTGPSASDVDLAAFLENVFDNENYAFPPQDMLSTSVITEMFPGLTAIPAVQRVVSTTAIGFNTAEIALVQVVNSADVSAVVAILQNRINRQIAGGAYYPAAVEQWENNHRIVEHGNYIMMVVHSSCDDIAADFNALF